MAEDEKIVDSSSEAQGADEVFDEPKRNDKMDFSQGLNTKKKETITKKQKSNRKRSNRIMYFVVAASLAVLLFIIFSLGGDSGRNRQKGPRISRVTAANTSGLTLVAPPEPQKPDFELPEPEPEPEPEIVLHDDGTVGPPEPQKPAVRIVKKQPSDEYRQRRTSMLLAMASNTQVVFNDSEYEASDAGAGGDTQAGVATGGDMNDQSLFGGMNGIGAQGMGLVGGQFSGRNDNSVAMEHQDRNLGFVNRISAGAAADDEYNPHTRRGMVSRYELKAGTIISGALINGINSDLPGTVLGQVSENIYDSATGAHLLIPQGSKIIGEYDAHVVYGQQRVLVVWTRIIFPDGTSLNIGGLIGSDQAGYSGLKQKIDNHYGRMITAALFASVFVAAGKVATDNDKNDDGTQTKAAEAVMEQMSSLGARIAEKNLNVAPTLRILPGFRFSIITTKDMAFAEPYYAVVPR